jgi:hypothetical protein
MTTASRAETSQRESQGGGKRSRLADLAPARRGALIFIVASLVFSATDALTKTLVSQVPVADVIWGRPIAYLVAVVAIAGRGHPGRLLVSSRKRTQIARGSRDAGLGRLRRPGRPLLIRLSGRLVGDVALRFGLIRCAHRSASS